MNYIDKKSFCTRCGGNEFYFGSGCVKCDENPYDKIKELEAEINDLEQENQRLKEEKEKIIHFALLLYRSEYAGDEKYLMDDFHRSLQKALEG